MNRGLEALRERRVEQEPAMTDRMLGMIEEAVNGLRTRGIRWRAKTLTDRGPGSQEVQYGADFLGVLNIDLPDFAVSKGFLAQAKLVRNERIDDLGRLKHQCQKMLDLSPESFVFLYGEEVRVVPAISILGSDVDPTQLYSRSAQRFFEEHLQCFIGDRGITSPTPDALPELRRRAQARSALLIAAEGEQLQLPKE